jgi:hypothetical protein
MTEHQMEQDFPDASQLSLHNSNKINTHTHTVYHLNRLESTFWIKCRLNNFEMPMSFVMHFCGVCSNLFLQ